MKEFIWKVCCLIWHFDERVIREYKEQEYQTLKKIEEKYWNLYTKKKELLLEVEKHNVQVTDDNFVPYHYGTCLSSTNDYQCFWNNIYDRLFALGYELGNKTEELNDLRNKRD